MGSSELAKIKGWLRRNWENYWPKKKNMICLINLLVSYGRAPLFVHFNALLIVYGFQLINSQRKEDIYLRRKIKKGK